MPLLPHGGTRIAFCSNDARPNLFEHISYRNDDAPLHLGSDALNNQYEVPYGHYTSANNLSSKHHHPPIFPPPPPPPPNVFSTTSVSVGAPTYFTSQCAGDSLPNIINAITHNDSSAQLPASGLRTQPQGTSNSNSVSSNIGVKFSTQDVRQNFCNSRKNMGHI